MKQKIPKFKTNEEIAAFWDTHDFTDYIEDTQPADDVVFEHLTRETISIRLGKDPPSSSQKRLKQD